MLQIVNDNFKIIKDNRNYILYVLKKNKKKKGEDFKLIGYYSSVLSALNRMVRDEDYSKLVDKSLVKRYKKSLQETNSFIKRIDKSLAKFDNLFL